jgi:hypothetical protein
LSDNAHAIQACPEAFTGEVFPTNAFSKRFYFVLRKVPDEVDAVRAASRRNAFVVSYSLMEIFQSDLIQFAEAVLKRNFMLTEEGTYWDAFYDLLGSPKVWLSNLERATLDFLRCRRNCVVHRNGTANNAFLTLQRQKGTLLNRHWRQVRHIHELDFKSATVVDFAVDEIIDILNISRDLMKTLDHTVCESLPRELVLTHVATSFQATCKKLKRLHRSDQFRTFKTFARIQYDLTLTEEEIQTYLSSRS